MRGPTVSCFPTSWCGGAAQRSASPPPPARESASPLEAEGASAFSPPLQLAPPLFGRRSVISPHRALVATPADDRGEGLSDRDDRGLYGAYREDDPADGASEETPGGDRDDSPGEDESDDGVLSIKAPPRKVALPKPCLRAASSHKPCEDESDVEAFEESERTLRRAADPRRVAFDNADAPRRVEIPNLEDYGWRCRRECYWQPEEYAQMARARVRLERAVLETGGREAIPGESRRGLGLVCEPETRLARASKIQQTARAVLKLHAEGATPSRLAKYAAEASRWATKNALICAAKDTAAARADAPDSSRGRPLRAASPVLGAPPAEMPRCDSNTASTDGLASMVRNDSLTNLSSVVAGGADYGSPDYASSTTRRRIAPAAAGAVPAAA